MVNDATKIYVYTVNIDKSIYFTLGKPIQIIPHRTDTVHDYTFAECCYTNNYYYISIAATQSTSNMSLMQISVITDIYYIK